MHPTTRSRVCTSLLIAATLIIGGCDSPPAIVGPGGECGGHGPIADVSKEPNYSADYLHRWTTRDGCGVRLDYLMRREGANACGGAEVADILMGTPLGASSDKSDARIYVRDPTNVFGDDFVSEAFDADAELPSEARDTGYRDAETGAELWMEPHDDSFVYLVFDDQVERWPKDDSPAGCG